MKRSLYLIIMVLYVITPIMADTQNINDTIYTIIEHMPEYEGGKHAIIRFIHDNLQYPEDALQQHWEGRVVCNFIIEQDGRITNINVYRSSGIESVDNEAIRIVGLMDQWHPGMIEGNPIRCKYTLPIYFRLEQNESTTEQPLHHPSHKPHKELYDHTPVIDQEGYYIFVDQMPQFHGGQRAFGQYISQNLKYPQNDDKAKRVICQFIVTKSGKIKNVRVQQSCGNQDFDNEAVRMLSEMPKWIPGRQDGKKVEVKFTLPVFFK